MTLKIHDTLSRRKREFRPIDPSNVRLYVCGPTVYDYAHIGNARPVVVFDVLARLLRQHYGADHVTYVRNITDVDDKIIDAARKSGEPIGAITERTTRAYHEDMAALGALPPDIEPRATDHIGRMIAMIERLIKGGHGYEADGHVLFHVPSMPDYGRLSGNSRDEQIAGARVDVASYKKDPADFVLWKPSAGDQPGWDSPWGRGRPGWHIECSAMAGEHLGTEFDIHGGGQDLIFPHHENEIAQSRCAHGTDRMANYWMHNGYLMAEGEKMSKSLGNFYTVRQLLEEGWPGEALRLALLSIHYRQPLDFTRASLREAKARLDRWYRAKARLESVEATDAADTDERALCDALDDDLNTALAFATIDRQADAVIGAEEAGLPALKGPFLRNAELLGVLSLDSAQWFRGGTSDDDKTVIDALIAERLAARARRDFAEADRIRDTLAERGIVLEDKPGGVTEWRRAG
ncbi:cysteine--tRNA ligase [Inquilinus sp. CAU 1745]|uniref:cysteine--tRNA ligase n=1 Tax=Inquilinus sp. CAU 1745 TaxID=3140369 RepID=UPI00325BBE25